MSHSVVDRMYSEWCPGANHPPRHQDRADVRAGGTVKIPGKMSADKDTIPGVINTDIIQPIIVSISRVLSPWVLLIRLGLTKHTIVVLFFLFIAQLHYTTSYVYASSPGNTSGIDSKS